MNTREKRDDQKLEGMMNVVKGILESIVFKQEAENHTSYGGSTRTYYVGQPKEQIKNKIKVVRLLLVDISKEIDK